MAAMQAGVAISRTGTLRSSWGTALEAKGSGGTIGRRNAYGRHKGGAQSGILGVSRVGESPSGGISF